MATGKQLRKAVKMKELTMDEAAEKLDVSRPTLYNWVAKAELDANILQIVKERLQIDLNEPSDPYITQRQESKMKITTFMVPLVPIKVQAGYIESYMLDDFIEQLDKYPMAPGINPRGADWRWFEVQGESMEPTLYEGDYILCSSVNQEDWRSLENYYMYVIISAGENRGMWVKRIKKRGSTQLSLYSDNKKVKPRLIELSDVREIWKVRRQLNARMPPPEKIED